MNSTVSSFRTVKTISEISAVSTSSRFDVHNWKWTVVSPELSSKANWVSINLSDLARRKWSKVTYQEVAVLNDNGFTLNLKVYAGSCGILERDSLNSKVGSIWNNIAVWKVAVTKSCKLYFASKKRTLILTRTRLDTSNVNVGMLGLKTMSGYSSCQLSKESPAPKGVTVPGHSTKLRGGKAELSYLASWIRLSSFMHISFNQM